jgi:fructose-1,6-bisphosphatase/inositol monophosphatase family enzyme
MIIPDIEQVARIIREVAAAEIMPRFRQLAEHEISEKKGPGDLVTIADIEAERRLTDELSGMAPDTVVVGEEGADANPSLLSALEGERPVWLVDPVDGTSNFANGKECFAVIVGYCRGGKTLAGWILDPVSDSMAWAAAGEGAWLNGPKGTRRLQVAPTHEISHMTGSLGNRLAHHLRKKRQIGLDPVPGHIVRYRCTGREYMDLARGLLDFAQYTRLKPWDHAAGILIHAEAGGYSRITDTGEPYRPAPFIQKSTVLLARDKACWKDLRSALAP